MTGGGRSEGVGVTRPVVGGAAEWGERDAVVGEAEEWGSAATQCCETRGD